MDIPLSVAGSMGVEDSLKAAYLEYEMMEGKNQYRCSKCDKLVDAKKVNQNAHYLTLYLLVSSTDPFCKKFGPRSGPTKCRT